VRIADAQTAQTWASVIARWPVSRTACFVRLRIVKLSPEQAEPALFDVMAFSPLVFSPFGAYWFFFYRTLAFVYSWRSQSSSKLRSSIWTARPDVSRTVASASRCAGQAIIFSQFIVRE
jgi:hypothetical protein